MTSKGIPISSAVFENFFFINLICGPINKISAFSISFGALSCATAQISVSIPFASAVSFIFETNKLVDISDELANIILIIIITTCFLFYYFIHIFCLVEFYLVQPPKFLFQSLLLLQFLSFLRLINLLTFLMNRLIEYESL